MNLRRTGVAGAQIGHRNDRSFHDNFCVLHQRRFLMRIGILEDDSAQASHLMGPLSAAGHGCSVYASAARFHYALVHERFDVLIVGGVLPDTSGLSVLQRLRESHPNVPVLFMSSSDTEEDIVTALRDGADDCLVKPPRAGELVARAEALHRRAKRGAMAQVLAVSPYRFDSATGEVRLDDEPITLTSRQFELAIFLFRQPGQLFSRNHLLEAIWGVDSRVQTRTVDIHISQLRSLLRMTPGSGWRITSLYGQGYRLDRTPVWRAAQEAA